MIKIDQRHERSRFWLVCSPLVAIVLTILTHGVLFSVMGFDPVDLFWKFFVDPYLTIYGIGELGVKAVPLILCALGLSFCFKAGVWNIGAEGQLILGAIAGGGTALLFHGHEGWYVLPLVVLSGILGGAFWAAVPAFLRQRCRTNEILTSLMLVYIATLLLSYLVYGPWRNPNGFNFPETRLFSDSARLPLLIENTRLHIGLIFAVILTLVVWIFNAKHIIGFQLRVVGLSPRAAKFAGYSQDKLIWFAFLLSGAFAGLAGVGEVVGTIGQLVPTVSPGYGFTAIIVVFIGRLNAVGIFAAGFLLALTYIGVESLQVEVGMPQSTTGISQGLLLFYLLSVDIFVTYRVSIKFKFKE